MMKDWNIAPPPTEVSYNGDNGDPLSLRLFNIKGFSQYNKAWKGKVQGLEEKKWLRLHVQMNGLWGQMIQKNVQLIW